MSWSYQARGLNQREGKCWLLTYRESEPLDVWLAYAIQQHLIWVALHDREGGMSRMS